MKKLWELEAIGVSTQEETVHEKFLDTIHLNNGRYEVSLPWREQHALLPDNHAQAVSRLASVLKRLRKNPGLFEEYNRIIEEQFSRGIISDDVDPDIPVELGHVHYLPHHPVVHEDVQLLTRRQRYLSILPGQFWNRWKREYVVDLREHHRPAKEVASVAQSIASGDIFTVMEEGKSNRSTWKLGRIAEVHPGNDGFVRGATVKVASGSCKRKRLRRP